MIEILVVYYKRKQDFPTKIDKSLLAYLPSQSVDCVKWANYIQGPKSRKNQVE